MSDETTTVHLDSLGGRTLSCVICEHTRFTSRRAQLNTPAMTFFNLDWANRTADCLVCERCGYVHWFLEQDRA